MIAAKVLVFLALEAIYFVSCHSSFESHPEESLVTVFVKCLPIAYLIWLCASTKACDGEHRRYRDEITIGLIFSFLGDVCLVWRHALFIPGASFFAGAHFFYIRAFRFKPWGWESGAVIYLAGSVVFLFILPALKSTMDKVAVPLYVALIFAMWWRAVVRWQREPTLSSVIANFGAFVFLMSDFCLAIDKWRLELPMAAVIIMSLYYLAQFMITISVYVYQPAVLEQDELREKRG